VITEAHAAWLIDHWPSILAAVAATYTTVHGFFLGRKVDTIKENTNGALAKLTEANAVLVKKAADSPTPL
jgi:hypothetical protein